MNNRLDDLITVMLEIQIFSIKKGHNSGTPVTGFYQKYSMHIYSLELCVASSI